VIPTSTVPAVKAALFTLLQAQMTPANATSSLGVFYDEPGTNQPDDIVSVGACKSRQVVPFKIVGSGAAGAFWEKYTLEVTVACFRGGDDARAVLERAYVLTGQVETAVRNDPSIGGLVSIARPVGSHDDPQWDNQHKGRNIAVVIDIEVEAQI
jgi:hypothetical protein